MMDASIPRFRSDLILAISLTVLSALLTVALLASDLVPVHGLRTRDVALAATLVVLPVLIWVVIAARPSVVTLLVVAGALLIDVEAARVFRQLLISDVLLLVAAGVAFVRAPRATFLAPVGSTAIFGLFVISHLVSFARAGNPAVGVFTWLHLAFLGLVLTPVVTTLAAQRAAQRYVWLWAIVASAVLQAAIIDFNVLNGLQWQFGGRITGAFGNTNSWLLGCGFIGLVGIVIAGTRRQRAAASVMLAVLTPAVLFLRVRMLWVGILVGCAFLLFGQLRLRRAVVLVFGLAIALTVSYRLGVFPPAITDRIAAIFHPSSQGDLVARIEVVRLLAPAFEQSPVLGIGLGQSRFYLPDAFTSGHINAVHNIVIHAAVEGGVLAAIAILLLPVAAAVSWRLARRDVDAGRDRLIVDWSFACLLAIYVGAQLAPSLYEHVFYVLFGVLGSYAAVPGSSHDSQRPAASA